MKHARPSTAVLDPWVSPAGMLLLALLSPLVVADVQATDSLYRWVDDQGQVHFGDRPPSDQTGPVEMRTLPPAPAASAPVDDRYSVVNQARQMGEERSRREEARQQAERDRMEAQRQLLKAEAEAERARAASTQASRERYFVHPLPRQPPPPPPPRFSGPEPRPPPPRHERTERKSLRSLTMPSRSLHP